MIRAANPVDDTVALLLGIAALGGIGAAIYFATRKPEPVATSAPAVVQPIPGLPDFQLAPLPSTATTPARRRA